MRFVDFVGGYERTLRLYYDPSGLVLPETRLKEGWYKEVVITQITDGLRDTKLGVYVCQVTMQMLSAVWRRDTTVASTETITEGTPHTIPFVYPYFYVAGKTLVAELLNTGDRVGCVVEVTNNTGAPLSKVLWQVESGDKIQYAKWMSGVEPLINTAKLVVDSNPLTYRADVERAGAGTESVRRLQEPNLQFINFVDIYNGANKFSFDFDGQIEGIDVRLSYREEVEHL